MASSCSFHGIVGIEKAAPYSLEKRHFWRMDGFIPLPAETDEGATDLPATIFTYGGRTAPPDHGVYFINARIITTTTDDVTEIELYCVDELQSLDSGRALPSVIIAGKVSRGTAELAENRMFDIDVTQYGIMPQQIARIRCYYPTAHPRLDRTPIPSAEKHVIIQGNITDVDDKRCLVCVHNITLGPSTNVVNNRRHHRDAAPTAPPAQLKSFNWSGKGKKSKRASHADSDAESESTQKKKGKKKQAVATGEVVEQAEVDEIVNVNGRNVLEAIRAHENIKTFFAVNVVCEMKEVEIYREMVIVVVIPDHDFFDGVDMLRFTEGIDDGQGYKCEVNGTLDDGMLQQQKRQRPVQNKKK
ncbi:hypothetical protein CY34DRAFT_110824 [Suillus luteus UH-Slu-Lm8-n1]|uniref:Uncharacterized protein n=1 Tax=Suillus luteus UH-Slu-Lm8-n1 TaxID=930992 RepID=A0A0D0ALP6_9AGAM|nr:hypothetical protein CY34DRAFT_110824 [Suillus luteus UH-Slu-Lm8-n1]